MSGYFYEFRPKELNPENYNAKMKFWIDLILSYCQHKGSSSLTISELKEAFKRNGSSPYCLKEVITVMLNEQKIVDKNSFMQPATSNFTWFFNKVKEKVFSSQTIDDNKIFIAQSVAKKHAEIVHDHILNCNKKIISMDDLMQLKIVNVSKDGILMALQYLICYTKYAYMEENKQLSEHNSHHHKILIKVCDSHEIVQPITELERSIFNLESSEKHLMNCIDEKSLRLKDLHVQIKECIQRGEKLMAKSLLRKKHMMENDIIKTTNILDNIQTILQTIHNSNSDKAILHSYSLGNTLIKNLFAKEGLNVENVQDVIEDIGETIEQLNEFQSAIGTSVKNSPNYVDDTELEKELMDIMKQNEEFSVNQNRKDEKVSESCDLADLEARLRNLRSDFPELPNDSSSYINKKSNSQMRQ
jgi:charged multivesicular body protein 7